MKNTLGLTLPVLCVILLASCSNMTTTEQRVLSGAGIGAAVGTAGTAMTGGCVSCGAVLGTAVGAGAGYVIDQQDKSKKK
jgi:osmotically inducible lipoprotein OsmB